MLIIKNLLFRYTHEPLFKDLELNLKAGKSMALLGPSGEGKTTLLDCITGFENVEDGEIFIDQKLMSSKTHCTPPEKRNIGLVFQKPNLFPHLNIIDNISFGLKKDEKSKAMEWLKIIGLEEHGRKFPEELSGGQRQRVAIARAMAPKPRLILFDEPFSGLDFILKKKLKSDIREILTKQNATSLFVTHDIKDALDVADELYVLHEGHVHFLGNSSETNEDQLFETLKSYYPKDSIAKP
ncbi:MAG: ABC transporter ATP-binding protein [Bacteriovoracaceae bacterium]